MRATCVRDLVRDGGRQGGVLVTYYFHPQSVTNFIDDGIWFNCTICGHQSYNYSTTRYYLVGETCLIKRFVNISVRDTQ